MEEDNKSGLLKALFDDDNSKDEINLITEKIIGCAYKVSNELDVDFWRKFMKMLWLMKLEN